MAEFVPAEFNVPSILDGPGFHLEPLGVEHNDRDHAAWMSSIDHIHASPGFEASEWPHPKTLEENLEDLRRHARDFEARQGFTYSVLEGDDVIGCVYIYPSPRPGVAADVRSWVCHDRAEMDAVLWRAVSAWLADAWPFEAVDYAARD
jgi:hypothetical protein